MPTPAELAAAEGQDLRSRLVGAPGVAVVTGGQTGVDTEAAAAALRAGLAVHMVFPRGHLQEDGPVTPARRRRLRGASFHSLRSAEFRHRTWAAVSVSDAVVLLDPAGGDGCRETALAAAHYGRPLLEPGSGPVDAAGVAEWLAANGARVLMIAGCRGSLLAAAGESGEVRAQVRAIAAGARLRHDELSVADR